jgi:NADPH-dependent 2,4-dienoyl-CoA reductase/sulfur reductase-like enzyme
MRTVIVGAGQAGRRTAEVLRSLDAAGEITLIGEETELPYDRPPLSKEILLGEEQPRGLMQRDAAYYAEHRITLKLGRRVAKLDLERSRLETEDGERIDYDALVLATGARARLLSMFGAEDPRVLTLRSMADARTLRAKLRPGLRLGVVGAGLIGLEVAASASKLGCAVSVLEAADRIMARCVPAIVSQIIEDWHREAGVGLSLSCPLYSITPEESGLRLATGTGEIRVDLLLVAIGAVPNTELAHAAGIPVDNGILADLMGRTSCARVFAAGEVARSWHPGLQRYARYETWQVAQYQPVAVANAIQGTEQPFNEIPWHWTNQYGRNVQILGSHVDGLEWLSRGEASGKLTLLGMDVEGRIQGAVLIDNGREATPIRRLIASERSIGRDRLLDPGTAIKQL